MHNQSKTKLNTYAEDVKCGLAAAPKFLSCKYIYDDTGSKLFRQIMDLPEYYLTRAEAEVFFCRKSEITPSFKVQNKPLDLKSNSVRATDRKMDLLKRYFRNPGKCQKGSRRF